MKGLRRLEYPVVGDLKVLILVVKLAPGMELLVSSLLLPVRRFQNWLLRPYLSLADALLLARSCWIVAHYTVLQSKCKLNQRQP